ncbi:AbrB/MazE/SpoVT family DNA-binding domain-containing protein [Ramlibacter sp.]|uniref:AbrB/MazE/SpoVT family DNA-binding domain-containing protein n=1 Tax=Ramlibacter sp. TaxID=1917967 RepID=UPI003D0E7986
MQVEIQKWGNSGAIRLPAAIMKQVNIGLGDQLDLTTEDGKIVLAPAALEYRLEDLLAGITKQNRHAPADFGPAVGREAW